MAQAVSAPSSTRQMITDESANPPIGQSAVAATTSNHHRDWTFRNPGGASQRL